VEVLYFEWFEKLDLKTKDTLKRTRFLKSNDIPFLFEEEMSKR
jgi:hypothetical protein